MQYVSPIVEKVGLQLLLEPQASGVLFRAASASVGIILPAYQSYKAIENKKDNKADEQWLTYWVIYAGLSLVEEVEDWGLAKLPYYWHAKFAFLLWLQMPQSQGAKVLYTNYFKPAISRFEPKIDICIDKVGSVLMTLYSIYKVPMDQVAAIGSYGLNQLWAFLKWFADPNTGNGKTNGSAPAAGGPNPSQFITR